MPRVTAPTTVPEVDEALAFMATALWEAKTLDNDDKARVVRRYIDQTLDQRLLLSGA